MKLDDRDYRAQLARAVASVAAQSATLANLDAKHRLQQGDTYLAIAACFVLAVVMVPLMRKVAVPMAPSADAH